MLSNLLWWPWAQIGTEEPPVVGDTLLAGDRRVFNEVVRTRRPSDDEDDDEILAAWILSHIL